MSNSNITDLSIRPPAPPQFVVGLDLGTLADYSAMATLQVKAGNMKIDRFLSRTFKLGHLHRWDLKTAYGAVVEDVVKHFARPPLSGMPLVVDRTGVGVAVYEMLVKAKPKAHFVPVTITGGKDTTVSETDSCWSVPKRELAGVLQVLLGTQRLKIVPTLPLAKVLSRELATFKVKINIATGHDSYEAWRERDHDDLVLATALPCWYAMRCQRRLWLRIDGEVVGDHGGPGNVVTIDATPLPFRIDTDAPGWQSIRRLRW
jgi:hypothetical protein